jgi:hypothetical protein
MTVNPYPSQQEILAHLRTISHVEVFEGSVPDGEAIPMTPTGKVKPHIVVNFAGLTEPSKGVNGITGAQDDSFLQGVSTHAIAGDDDAARQLNGIALGKLLGFTPTHCGQVRPAFFAGVGQISSLGQPTRLSAVQSYRYLINA